MPCAASQSPPRPGRLPPRRPAAALLYRTVREHLETYLVGAELGDDQASGVLFHVQAAFREFLK